MSIKTYYPRLYSPAVYIPMHPVETPLPEITNLVNQPMPSRFAWDADLPPLEPPPADKLLAEVERYLLKQAV